jgi:CRP-like cAMP-binding protein/MFS family permease
MLGKVSRLRSRLGDSFTTLGVNFANPGLRRVQLAWMSTMVGQWAYYIALAVYAYDVGGAPAVGLVGLIRTVPAAIAAPFVGLLSDRYPRERVMLIAQVGRLLTLLLSAAALAGEAPAWVIFAGAGVMTILGTAIKPAQAAMLPSLASTPEELTAANVTFSSVESISLFAGPALGGLLLAVTDESVVFLIAAAGAAFAAFLVAGVRTEPAARPEPQRELRTEGFLAELLAGYRTIGSEPGLRVVAGLWAAHWLVAGAVHVLLVAAALELLDLGESGVGLLSAAIGIGGTVGLFVALGLLRADRLAINFATGLLIRGGALALIGVWPEPAVAFVLLFINGIGNTIIDASGSTLLQRMVRDEVRARVFGALQGILILGLGVGTIAIPVVIETAGVRGAMIATGGLLAGLVLLSARSLTRIQPPSVASAETLELLGSVPIFAPLPRATLEYLGGKMTTVTHPAGTIIFRQGETGDRYYLIEEGEAEVAVDGRVASTLGRGDGFGEIALMRDVPRTGTVTARTKATLHALERDDFIAAVTGHAESAQAADTVVADRLGSAAPEVARV